MRLDKSRQLLKLALMMQASSEGVGLQEIQQTFEVGRRTAERMRDALLDLFPHVEEIRIDGKTKRWRLPPASIVGLMHISVQDLAEMKTAIDLLKKEHLIQHADNLEILWLKIKGRMRPESAASVETDLEALLEAECHAMRSGPRPYINSKVIYILREAIKGFKKVALIYHLTKRDVVERVVNPYGIIYGMCHNLIGWCEDTQEFCSFSLSNITDIQLIESPYIRDTNFDLREYIERAFGVLQEEPFDVVWRFSAMVSDAVREYHFHPSQQIEEQHDGTLLLRFKAGGSKEMCWNVMGWEGHAEILEPSHLRQSYKEMVQHLYNQISIKPNVHHK